MKILSTLLLLSVVAAAPQPRTIEDYFKLLPAEYVTHVGDYGPLATVVDADHGYYAIIEKTSAPEAAAPEPVFEFALFRKADGGAVFVAANTLYDHACLSHQTFFLRHDGAKWSDVSSTVAPRLTAEHFTDDPRTAAALKRHKSWHDYLRYRLPRRGTNVEVTLRLCDTALEYDDALSDDDSARLVKLLQTATRKTVKLNWDRARGRFVVAR